MDPDDETLDPAPPAPAPPAPPAPPVPPAVPPAPPAPPPAPSGLPENERRALIADHSARAERKLLKKLFGTDDPAEVERLRTEQQARLDQHQQMVDAEATRKREQMSEVERLTNDVTRLTEENTQLKAKIQAFGICGPLLNQGDKVAAQQDAHIKGIAINHISPRWLKYSMGEFRDYVLSLPVGEQKKLDERRIGKWFVEFAKKEPTVALEPPKAPVVEPPAAPPAPPAPAPPAPPQRQVLAAGARPPGAGTKPNVPPTPADPFAGKTPLPGKPNSMNKQELRDYAKANGLSYPG